MLPKNQSLARRQLMKLKIYTGDKHPHAVQNPKAVKIEGRTGKVME
jgi:large subunit ribosomal protein L13